MYRQFNQLALVEYQLIVDFEPEDVIPENFTELKMKAPKFKKVRDRDGKHLEIKTSIFNC